MRLFSLNGRFAGLLGALLVWQLPHSADALDLDAPCTFARAVELVEQGPVNELWQCLRLDGGLLASRDADSRTLFQVAAARASDPEIILTLSAFDAPEVSEEDETALLEIAATENPNPIILLTLRAIGRHFDSAPALVKVLPSNRSFIWDEISPVAWADRTMQRAGNEGDCSRFLTEEFVSGASPTELAFCQSRADPMALGAGGNTALHIAMRVAAAPSVVDALLSAIPRGSLSSYLSAQNDERRTALQVGARYAHDAQSVAAVLNWGADPNALTDRQTVRFRSDRGVSALAEAVRNHDIEARYAIVALLLASGADVAVQLPYHETDELSGGQTPLHLAARLDEEGSVFLLLLETEYQRVSSVRRTARGMRDWTRRLTDRFMDDDMHADMSHRIANAEDELGWTALDYLMRPDTAVQVVEYALAYGLSPDHEDHREITPLMRYASSGTDPELMRRLIDISEARCVTSAQGASALAYASDNEHLQMDDRSGAVASPVDLLRRECGR